MGSFRQNDYFAIAEMILKGKYITLALLACKILVFISLNRDLSLHSGAAIYVWGENKLLSTSFVILVKSSPNFIMQLGWKKCNLHFTHFVDYIISHSNLQRFHLP